MKQTNNIAVVALVLFAGCGTDLPVEDETSEVALLTIPGDHRGDSLSNQAEVVYHEVDGHAVISGDIVVPWSWLSAEGRQGERSQALADVDRHQMHWPSGIVPYVFGDNLPRETRDHVKAAIAHYHARTNIRLVPRTTQTSFVKFVPSDGCRSYIGRIGGPQEIWLAPNCGTSAAIHEIGHALGVWHEHTRQDRDDYIDVRWNNIQAGAEGNFDKYPFGRDRGAYDFASVMHYHSGAFAKDAGLFTIVKKGGGEIRHTAELSAGDVRQLATVYPPPADRLASDPRLCLTLDDSQGRPHGEMGRIRITHEDRRVEFAHPFDRPPVVFAETMTRRGGDPSVVEISDVTTSGFTVRVSEWDYEDGRHTAEDVHYLAVPPGRRGMHVEGTRMFVTQAGVVDVGKSYRAISSSGGSKRVVFAQPQADAARVAVARVDAVTNEGFRVRLQSEDRLRGKALPSVPTGWISITRPHGSLGHYRSGRTHTHRWSVVDFERAGWESDSPIALVQMQSAYGGDASHLRMRHLEGARLDVFVEEERSLDDEVEHTTEKVGAIALPRKWFSTDTCR